MSLRPTSATDDNIFSHNLVVTAFSSTSSSIFTTPERPTRENRAIPDDERTHCRTSVVPSYMMRSFRLPIMKQRFRAAQPAGALTLHNGLYATSICRRQAPPDRRLPEGHVVDQRRTVSLTVTGPAAWFAGLCSRRQVSPALDRRRGGQLQGRLFQRLGLDMVGR